MYKINELIRQIKSIRMRWAGHVARMGVGRNLYRVVMESTKGGDHLEDQGIDGRMGSEWILRRLFGGLWIGFTWLRLRTAGELFGMR
jgi:hypothetical protein